MSRLFKYIRDAIHEHRDKNKEVTHRIWHGVNPLCPETHLTNLLKDNKVKTSRYEWWNFIPFCLFEQFQKLANFYFLLLIVLLILLGERSPISPITTILPLSFVITVTCLKQAYEDYQRHRSDDYVNTREYLILENGSFVTKKSKNIKIGDIVQVNNNEEFPCDLILLSSSNPVGICYITTINFDGETNLKPRYCLSETSNMTNIQLLSDISCYIECDLPNSEIYKFNGFVTTYYRHRRPVKTSLNYNNFLLRGAYLRNTDVIYGMAVYIGSETKLALNQKVKRQKVSVVDKKLNKYILCLVLLLFTISSFLTFMYYLVRVGADIWYLDNSSSRNNLLSVLIDFSCYIALLNNMIPISLYVTLEIEKLSNSFFIDWDLNMYHKGSNDPARCNTSDNIEELGQIEYIFSDKTGTLTENKMEFIKCVVNDKIYKFNDTNFNVITNDCNDIDKDLIHFYEYICLCHSADAQPITTCQTQSDSNKTIDFKYNSYSPDEIALLEASNRFGIKFVGKFNDFIKIDTFGVTKSYSLKHVLEFDPSRKRMSVIVQDHLNNYYMICKGADSHVLPLCEPLPINDKVMKHINDFSVEGYRTLMFAYRKLTSEQFEKYDLILKKASLTVIDRDKKLEEAYEEVEKNLIVVGGTAVEDRLQYGVTRAIQDFRKAGIKIWVLTGDKEETAITISLRCGHISKNVQVFYLTQRISDIKSSLEEYRAKISQLEDSDFALLIDGVTLKTIMDIYKDEIKYIFSRCNTVLCCRMSPLQKSQVVNFVRNNIGNNPITLAIGDGANDCSMIQEAHIGIGLMGQEGRQAVYASDIAIHRFRYLRHLLLFHGVNFYHRIAMTILYFFYKNIIMAAPTFIYVFYTNLSPISLYEDVYIIMYNTLITSLPIIFYGFFEQPYPKTVLLNNPQIYKTISRNKLMNWSIFIFWFLNAIWQSVVIFYVCYFIYNDGFINIPYQIFSSNFFGILIYTYVVICTTAQIQLITRFWTLHMITTTFGSLFYYAICATFASLIYSFNRESPVFAIKFQSYYVFMNIITSPSFWIGLVIIIPLAFFPYIIKEFYEEENFSKSFNKHFQYFLPVVASEQHSTTENHT